LGEEKIELVGVDNDHAFVDPLLRGRSLLGFGAEYTKLQVKCILYCFDQMQEPIHPKTRELFLKLGAAQHIQGWLIDLVSQEKRYAALFSPKEMASFFKATATAIPILFPKGCVANIYEKLLRLQKILQEDANITPLQLLRCTIPELGVRYEEAFKGEKTPWERFDTLCGVHYSKAIKGRLGTKLNSRQILNSQSLSPQCRVCSRRV